MTPIPQHESEIPPLRAGDRLTQPEFHRRYEQYPEDVKFELVDGVVYLASPLRNEHGTNHLDLCGVFWIYQVATPGLSAADNTTTILGEKSEPQPDLSVRILAEYGGQSRIEQGYITGAPELLAEVAFSSKDIDLSVKRADYQKAGVQEYLVVNLGEGELRWFDFRDGNELRPRRGIYRSRIFPGLWIDGPALLAGNGPRLLEVVQQGIASPGHARFVAKLGRTRDRLARRG